MSAAPTTTRPRANPQFQPQYDVVGKGFRQPGSAFKPFNYAVAHRRQEADRRLDADGRRHDFAGDYSPSDADNLERGPVRVRNALQFSLNIPAVKAMGINGPDRVFAKAKDFGMNFQGKTNGGPRPRARRPGGPPGRPRDRVRDARQRRQGDRPHDDPDDQGRPRARTSPAPYVPPARQAGRQPAGGLHRHRHPRRQHEPERQPVLGQVRDQRARRPPPGDAQDRHEQRRQGPQRLRLHRAADRRPAASDGAYALAVGVWNGNSDNSLVSTPAQPVFSIDVSTYVWQGFLNEATAKLADHATSPGPTAWSRPRSTRSPGSSPSTGGEVRRRMVHRRHRAARDALAAGHLRRRRPRPRSSDSRTATTTG